MGILVKLKTTMRSVARRRPGRADRRLAAAVDERQRSAIKAETRTTAGHISTWGGGSV